MVGVEVLVSEGVGVIVGVVVGVVVLVGVCVLVCVGVRVGVLVAVGVGSGQGEPILNEQIFEITELTWKFTIVRSVGSIM